MVAVFTADVVVVLVAVFSTRAAVADVKPATVVAVQSTVDALVNTISAGEGVCAGEE